MIDRMLDQRVGSTAARGALAVWARRLAAASACGVLMLAGPAVLAQTTPSGGSPPAQKKPAKEGTQSGDAPAAANKKESSEKNPGNVGATGAEKTPAKSGTQSGKEPRTK